MRRISWSVRVLCFGALLFPAPWLKSGAEPAALSYVDLIGRLTDLEHLAVLPQPGEKCAQWSSYDRATRYNAATNTYEGWDANGDGGQFIREENGKVVMAEMEGPGCIWRIWSAKPENGHVRIYLDGAAEPIVDLPFRGYFDGTNEPFTRKNLVYSAATGWDCYVPIPYQKSCKIVADKGWGAYFHFTYGTFPKDTRVPGFKPQLTKEESDALDRADLFLGARGADPAVLSKSARKDEEVVKKTVDAKPNRAYTVARVNGPRGITGIRVKVDLPKSPADRKALRELAIRITWDDEKKPAVWAPLGDFFGTAAGANPYRSLPMGLKEDGWWYCYWYMPFAKKALVELANDGAEKRQVEFEIVHASLSRPIEQLGRFHAKWHRDVFLPTESPRWIDWPIVKAQGSGRFCGVMLHIWNPVGGWWGEGDEKFFVDGEKFPSTIGTGSEDYFGYAWGNPELFARAYHNQTISMGNKGHISVNRLHITDNVPFRTSFEGCIEKYYKNERPCLYAAVAYWYLAAGCADPYEPVAVTDRVGYCQWETPAVFKVEGAIEGETIKQLACAGGTPTKQELSSFEDTWSDNQHLWWINGKPGDTLDLALPVAKAGTYAVVMQLTRARDYGVVQFYLDGEKLGGPVDLYNPDVRTFGPYSFGVRDLAAGEHRLRVEIVGANDKAEKSYMCGIDYVRLDPGIEVR